MAENVNPDTGEITDVDETRAADGTRRYPAATTLTDMIHMLGDGQFNRDSADKLSEFAEAIEEMGCDAGKKVKGKITLTIDVEREHDGVYFFTPALVTKLPTEKGERTIGWVTEDNKFSPNRPRQGQLFGTIREVTIDQDVRRI